MSPGSMGAQTCFHLRIVSTEVSIIKMVSQRYGYIEQVLTLHRLVYCQCQHALSATRKILASLALIATGYTVQSIVFQRAMVVPRCIESEKMRKRRFQLHSTRMMSMSHSQLNSLLEEDAKGIEENGSHQLRFVISSLPRFL